MIIEFKNKFKIESSNCYWKREDYLLKKIEEDIFKQIRLSLFGPVWRRISLTLSGEIWRNMKNRLE